MKSIISILTSIDYFRQLWSSLISCIFRYHFRAIFDFKIKSKFGFDFKIKSKFGDINSARKCVKMVPEKARKSTIDHNSRSPLIKLLFGTNRLRLISIPKNVGFTHRSQTPMIIMMEGKSCRIKKLHVLNFFFKKVDH